MPITSRFNSGPGTGSEQTISSTLLTPAANSMWIIAMSATNDNHTANKTYAISGGAESYTAIGALDVDGVTATPYAMGGRVWRQQFGATPAARTVTVDPWTTTNIGWVCLVILEVTGHDTTTPIVQTAAANSDGGGGTANLNATATFSSAPSDDQVLFSFTDSTGNTVFDAAPSGFTLLSQNIEDESSYAAESSTNTTAAVTHGTSSGTNFGLWIATLEIEPSSGVTGDLRGAVGTVGRMAGAKLASGSMRSTGSVITRATTTKIAIASMRSALGGLLRAAGTAVTPDPVLGAVRGAIGTVARITGTKLTTSSMRSINASTIDTVGAKTAIATMRSAGASFVRAAGTASQAGVGAALGALGVTARITGRKLTAGAMRSTGSVIGEPSGRKLATASMSSVGSGIARVAGAASLEGLSAARAALGVTARITGQKVAVSGSRGLATVSGRMEATRAAIGAANVTWGTGGLVVAIRSVSSSVRGAFGVVLRTSSLPPLNIDHEAKASVVHHSSAEQTHAAQAHRIL